MKTIRIRMLRQAFPAGGGAVLAAGRTYELRKDVVDRLPAGSFKRVRKPGSAAARAQAKAKRKTKAKAKRKGK